MMGKISTNCNWPTSDRNEGIDKEIRIVTLTYIYSLRSSKKWAYLLEIQIIL